MSTPADLARVPRSMAWRAARCREIIGMHSRVTKHGVPILCTQARKITYDDLEHAQACADQLIGELGEQYYQWPYQCTFSKRGHWHLTSTHHPAEV